MIRITHVINNLQTGGAEMTLLRLMERLDRDRFEPSVIAMIGEGTVGPKLRDLDVPVVALGASRRRVSLGTLLGVRRHLRAFRPDVIQAWMYHSNLAAYLARGAVKEKPALAWNIRHSLHDLAREPGLTRMVIRAGARRSPKVDAVVANSTVCMRQHEAIGYHGRRNVVIPNGFDLEEIQPVDGARECLHAELGLAPSDLLVGCVGRLHPVKDQAGFVKAMADVAGTRPNVHCVLVGRDCEPGGPAEALRLESGLGDRLHLMGERRPLQQVLSGLDLLVVSSRGEGFPNVLAEAMACEVACVTTDVGDAATILGDPGRVVPSEDPSGLASVIGTVLDWPGERRRAVGEAARRRISDHFPIERIAESYQELWEELASMRSGKAEVFE